MTMSDLEIVADYRAAKRKPAQVGILAELNSCDKATICKILLAHPESGFTAEIAAPRAKRAYNRKPKAETPAAEPAATVKPAAPTAAAPTPETPTTLGAWLRSVADILDATPGCEAVDLSVSVGGYWLNVTADRIGA